MKIIDGATLAALSQQAATSPRGRMNSNLHGSLDDPCHRLLNAVEPGSYIRPHRHYSDPRPETILGLRGKVVLITFDDAGNLLETVPLGPGQDACGVDLAPETWHTLVSLEPGSVFFEAKAGPMAEKDLAPWAPEEGGAEGAAFLAALGRASWASLNHGFALAFVAASRRCVRLFFRSKASLADKFG